MNRKLKSIAMQLSDSDLEELIRIKRTGGKKVETLRKKREKLVGQLAAVDAEIAQITGEAPAGEPRRRGGPRGPRAAVIAKGTVKDGRVGRRTKVNFVAKMREVFTEVGTPLRAREIVDNLPRVGVKVKDIPYTRKRVSVALATNKCFEQVSRGIYQLRED